MIEQNIPIPDKHRGTKRQIAESMEVGDSVFFDNKNEALYICHCLRVKRGHKSGVMRKVEGGYRTWRRI